MLNDQPIATRDRLRLVSATPELVMNDPALHRAARLPRQLTSFVGRDADLANLDRLVQQASLVTLVGSGGAGKTRLAIEYAARVSHQYANGVYFVDLTSVSDPALAARAVAAALSLPESIHRSPTEALVAALREQTLLLTLDNCEHLIEACADLAATLLGECPGLQIVATSRERLGIDGESVFLVTPLDTPAEHESDRAVTADAIYDAPAVQLFVDRATAAQPQFRLTDAVAPAVSAICRRLDGVPLAIELAAARVNALSPDQIAARLDQRFRLLVGGARTAPPRQKTLAALIEWSHNLLSVEAKALFRRLAVFSGGWTLDALEATLGDDALESFFTLIEKSLIVFDSALEPRYRFLESIREYALAKLRESDEEATYRWRHFEWCCQLARAGAQEVFKPGEMAWRQRLESEFDNIRSAIAWAGGQPEGAERALELAGTLNRYWDFSGYLREGFTTLTELLAITTEPTRARADALLQVANLGMLTGQISPDDAQRRIEASVALCRDLDYVLGYLVASARLCLLHWNQGDANRVSVAADDVLTFARQVTDPAILPFGLSWRAEVARHEGKLDYAEALLQECLPLARVAGQARGLGLASASLARLRWARGSFAEAAPLALEGLHQLRAELGALGAPYALETLAWVESGLGRHQRAAQLFGAAASGRDRVGAGLLYSDPAQHERAVGATRAALGEPAFARAFAAGRRLTPAEAVAFGLAQTEATMANIEHQRPSECPPSPAPATNGPWRRAAAVESLTEREREVATLVARGYTNRQIADELVITPKTAAHHVQNILNKHGFHSRAQIAAWHTGNLAASG